MFNLRTTVAGDPKILTRAVLACALCSNAACGGETGKSSPSDAGVPPACSKSRLEADLDSQPFSGPGVDPETGALRFEPGSSYVVSSTYGVPKPGPQGAPVTDRYVQLFSAIEAQLAQQPGLLAMRLASSEGCGSGRTLAVWKSEEEMFAFVTSDAHFAAMKAVNEVLKPGYGVTHWSAESADDASWEEAVKQLAKN